MSSAPPRETASASPASEIRIVNWPLRDAWRSRLPLAAGLVAFAALCGWMSRTSWGAIAGLVVLLLASWRQWVPVTFEIGPGGLTYVTLGRGRKIAWRQIASCELRGDGVLFLLDAEPAPAAILRGMFVRCPGQRDQVIALARRYMEGRRGGSSVRRERK